MEIQGSQMLHVQITRRDLAVHSQDNIPVHRMASSLIVQYEISLIVTLYPAWKLPCKVSPPLQDNYVNCKKIILLMTFHLFL